MAINRGSNSIHESGLLRRLRLPEHIDTRLPTAGAISRIGYAALMATTAIPIDRRMKLTTHFNSLLVSVVAVNTTT